MTRRRALPLGVAAAAVLFVAAALVSQAPAERSETGLVVAVDSVGLTEVRGFTLRTADGRQLAFRIRSLENEAEFPPGHLAEHIGSGEPVRVFYRDEAGELVALRLEDAPSPS